MVACMNQARSNDKKIQLAKTNHPTNSDSDSASPETKKAIAAIRQANVSLSSSQCNGIGNGNGYGSHYSENASLADPSIAAFIEHGGITMTGGGLVSEAEAHELLHHQQLHSSEQYQQQYHQQHHHNQF